jgi:hypothetical protein
VLGGCRGAERPVQRDSRYALPHSPAHPYLPPTLDTATDPNTHHHCCLQGEPWGLQAVDNGDAINEGPCKATDRNLKVH